MRACLKEEKTIFAYGYLNFGGKIVLLKIGQIWPATVGPDRTTITNEQPILSAKSVQIVCKQSYTISILAGKSDPNSQAR